MSRFTPSGRYSTGGGVDYTHASEIDAHFDEVCGHCDKRRGAHYEGRCKLEDERVIDPQKARDAVDAKQRTGIVSPREAAQERADIATNRIEVPIEGWGEPMKAPDILKRAAKHMEDRAAARDQSGGERSMKRTVDAFNALTGHAMSERDGWMFMVVLKAARACTTPTGIADDYEDLAAYAGLAGEAAQR